MVREEFTTTPNRVNDMNFGLKEQVNFYIILNKSAIWGVLSSFSITEVANNNKKTVLTLQKKTSIIY